MSKSLTKAHFVAVAKILSECGEQYPDHCDGIATLQVVAYELATLYQRANPNFSRSRFIRACNVKRD